MKNKGKLAKILLKKKKPKTSHFLETAHNHFQWLKPQKQFIAGTYQ